MNPAHYTVGIPLSPNTPSTSGGAVDAYSVSPALPAGLGLNTTTGVITGTPGTASSTAIYVVTASNAVGSATVGLSITVDAAPIPPSGLTYSTNPAVYTVGITISPNAPSSTGGPISSYSVSPVLPAGLRLDTSTGVISGTPSAPSTAADYVVTASGTGGSATAGLNITVGAAPVPPAGLTYPVNPALYTVGFAISPNTPRSSGGAVDSYSISPALPAGLALDPSTGVIRVRRAPFPPPPTTW